MSFGDRALDAVSAELMSVRFTVAVDTDWSDVYKRQAKVGGLRQKIAARL